MLASQIERIIASGGGVSISGENYLASQLERLAAIAANSRATLRIRNSQRFLPSQLERIAAIGNGRVIFEFE